MKIGLSVADKEIGRGAESPYFKALVAAGAKPEELRLVNPRDARRARAEEFDGILFAGGQDVEPEFYGEKKKYDTVEVDRARDEFEMTLLDRALDLRLPVLGICRGIQMINVKFGGTLYQELAKDMNGGHRQEGSRSAVNHGVTVTDPDSQLAEVVTGSCRVNTLHHQAIKRLGRGLKVTAHSEDGLVEAVESADAYPFLMAVQWHPEELVAEHAEQRKLLELFVAKCREAARRTSAAKT
jgi:putative glutamine amidotransferase